MAVCRIIVFLSATCGRDISAFEAGSPEENTDVLSRCSDFEPDTSCWCTRCDNRAMSKRARAPLEFGVMTEGTC